MAFDGDRVQALLDKCKHPDNDVKADAIAKLQMEFEEALEIPDPDPILATFKTLLRSSNPHISTSALHALPPLLRLLVTEHAVRHALVAFMASGGGGLLERMGDQRERTREVAREAVKELAGRCLALGISGMKGKMREGEKEGIGAMFERYVKEGGFGSKVARVREQCLLLLTSIRHEHPTFPLRPYLTPLIDTLQDPDGIVRTLSQQTILTLFGPGSGVSDAARTELKKEAGRRNVRKGIWDPLWERVIGVASAAAEGEEEETGGAEVEAARAPTIGRSASHGTLHSVFAAGSSSRPASRLGASVTADTATEAEVMPVYVASSRDLEMEFAAMLPAFAGKESEQNWLARETAIIRVRGMLKGDVWRRMPDAFFAGLKGGFLEGSLKALSSLRTTVSSTTCLLYATLSSTLQHSLDPLFEVLYLPLLRMSSLTKKLTASLSQSTLSTLLQYSSPLARVVLPALFDSLSEKNTQTRQYVVQHLRVWLTAHGRAPVEHLAGGLDAFDKALRRALADQNPAVREEARKLFWAFEPLWQDRARLILESLDSVGRKGVERANPHVAGAQAPGTKTTPSTPAAKRSGIAATIAAHRNRMKAGGAGGAPPMARAVTSPPSMTAAAKSVPAPNPPSAFNSPLKASTRLPVRPGMSPSKPSHIPVPHGVGHARSPSDPASPSTSASHIPVAHARTASGSSLSSTRPRTPGAVRTTPRAPSSRNIPKDSSKLSSSSLMDEELPPPSDTLMDADTLMNAEETLLLATKIPVPGDDDVDESFNPFSFDSPAPPPRHPAAARDLVSSPPHHAASGSTVSTPTSRSFFSPAFPPTSTSQQSQVPQAVIEERLRAQAEQAESAADRLLELVEPSDDEHTTVAIAAPTAPGVPSLELPPMNGASGKENAAVGALPRTPVNKRAAAIMRQAAMFKDSPVAVGSPSPIDVLGEKRHETSWWLKRIKMAAQPLPVRADPSAQPGILAEAISAVSNETANARTLRELAQICIDNPCQDTDAPGANLGASVFGSRPSLAPSSSSTDVNGAQGHGPVIPEVWQGGRLFDSLFDSLVVFLSPSKPADVLEYGLVLIWEMLEHQATFLEGREMELFTLLMEIRYCNKPNVLEATTTLRDALTSRFDPVFGIATANACLRGFLQKPIPTSASASVHSGTHAFGLVGVGKFILRLPAEILEDELPRLKGLLTSGLTDPSSDVREAANIAVVAAQLVLQDETHLFTLLDGLEDAKKNLLTYYFERYKTRSSADSVDPVRPQGTSQELIEKEMRRLDLKATPPRNTR